MAREWLAACLPLCAGCSLILDFSKGAVPIDAAIDAPYTQAECDYKEPNNTFDTAPTIDPTMDMGPAAICAPSGSETEDDAYFKFTVPTNTKVTIALMFTERPGGDLDLRLYDSTNTVIAQSRGFGDGETLVCPATSPLCPKLAPGTYAFEVFPGAAGQVNNYTFLVTIQ